MVLRSALRLVAFVSLVGLGAGCGTSKYQLVGTELAPGADAVVKAKSDSKRNLTMLEVDASHLVPADRVVEGGQAYVIWARRDQSVMWSRLGALELDDRDGEANLTVPELNFELIITAEVQAAPVSPSASIVFQTKVED